MPGVDVISPEGDHGTLPPESLQAGLARGFKLAVRVTSPEGDGGWLPMDKAHEAVTSRGFKIGQPSAQTEADKQPSGPGFAEGVAGAVGLPTNAAELTAAEHEARHPSVSKMILGPGGSALKDFGQNIYARGKQAVSEAYEAGQNIGSGQPAGPNLKKAALGVYQTANAAIPVVGEAANKVGEDVSQGNYSAALGRGLTTTALMGIGGERAGAETPRTPGEYVTAKMNAARTAPQVNTVKGMAQMAPHEIGGLEDIYRAAAPTGKNPGFRANLNAALPDLKAVAKDLDLTESKGGIISPDMRVRATVDAINGRLDSIAKNERVAQIQRNAGTPVDIKLNADARRGMEFLMNNAGEAGTQQLAASALKRGALPIEQADVLAQSANKYLKGYEKLPSEQKLTAQMTNPKIGGLKELDKSLGSSLNDTLTSKGEVGLRDYERRYAGLSAVRDALQDRMNAAELDQPGLIKGLVRPVANVLMKGKTGIASASQAAVADIRTGKALQSGFKKLSSGQ